MIKEILFKIQQEFKSSKNLINDFAKFNYRNLECMLGDLKPILLKYDCIITFNDEIVNVGTSNYIKSTATLIHIESGEEISTTAFAREDETKAGMSAGQMTGCGSSYSRKYALCGLCAVNEEKDLDALDNRPKQTPTPKYSTPAKPQIDNLEWTPEQSPVMKSNADLLTEFCAARKSEKGINLGELKKFYNYYSTKDFKGKMNVEQLWERWQKN